MSALHPIIERLCQPVVGYHQGAIAAVEPTAYATLLLLSVDRLEEAAKGLQWIVTQQKASGAVAVTPDAETPCWPTGLALLALVRAEEKGLVEHGWAKAKQAAATWILEHQGEPIEFPPEQRGKIYGHDTRLVAWPWVLGTHSWLEPTCLHVIALAAAGHVRHSRTQEALRLLRDRLINSGGCNYGNTTVLGQQLRPHLQPSGMAAVALSAEHSAQPKLQATLNYLKEESARTMAAASLSWSQLGLAAHGQEVAADRLETVAARALEQGSPHRLALLGHALLGAQSPLLPIRQSAPPSPLTTSS